MDILIRMKLNKKHVNIDFCKLKPSSTALYFNIINYQCTFVYTLYYIHAYYSTYMNVN